MTLTQPMVGLIASIVGIALPFIILYFALEGYDSRFKDKHLFFSIIVPLVVGTVISLFHISLSVSMLMFTMLPVVVLGLTVLETTAREVFLRANRFRGDPALPIYGLSTGLWFGAMIIFGRVYVHLMVREPDPIELGGICLFALTVACVNGAMGMEAGSRPRNEWESLGVQFLVGGAFNLALGFFYIFLIIGVDAGVLVVMAIITTAAYYVFTWERKRTITSRIPRDDESWGDYPGGPEGGDDMVAGRWTGDGKGGGVYDDGAVVDVTPASARSGAVGPKRRGGAGGGQRRSPVTGTQPRRLHRTDRREGKSRRLRPPGRDKGAQKTVGTGGVEEDGGAGAGESRPEESRGIAKSKTRSPHVEEVTVGEGDDVEYLVLDGGGKKGRGS